MQHRPLPAPVGFPSGRALSFSPGGSWVGLGWSVPSKQRLTSHLDPRLPLLILLGDQVGPGLHRRTLWRWDGRVTPGRCPLWCSALGLSQAPHLTLVSSGSRCLPAAVFLWAGSWLHLLPALPCPEASPPVTLVCCGSRL